LTGFFRLYSGNTVKRISNKPKGYLGGTGLACMLNMISSHTALGGHPMAGAFFETAAAGEIRKLSSILAPFGMYHWRSHGSSEADLLLEQLFDRYDRPGFNRGQAYGAGVVFLC
jgi:uncharacterized protein